MSSILEHLKRERVVLAPEIVLTPRGPEAEQALIVEGDKLAYVGPASELGPADAAEVRALPGFAVIPGFIDAHTHLAQTFGKILIGGEPAQIWRRLWLPMEAALDEEGDYVSASSSAASRCSPRGNRSTGTPRRFCESTPRSDAASGALPASRASTARRRATV